MNTARLLTAILVGSVFLIATSMTASAQRRPGSGQQLLPPPPPPPAPAPVVSPM